MPDSKFQWIIDYAENLSIERKKMVASTTSRNGVVRTISRGTLPKTITAKVPDGIPWTDLRQLILDAESLDKITPAIIEFKFSEIPWYYGDVDPGTNESYNVKCISFPSWTIFARNQVSWSGPFVFQEIIE